MFAIVDHARRRARDIVSAYLRRRFVRESLIHVRDLDDRLLADVGLTRDGLEAAVRGTDTVTREN